MVRYKPRITVVGGDLSANCATTTTHSLLVFTILALVERMPRVIDSIRMFNPSYSYEIFFLLLNLKFVFWLVSHCNAIFVKDAFFKSQPLLILILFSIFSFSSFLFFDLFLAAPCDGWRLWASTSRTRTRRPSPTRSSPSNPCPGSTSGRRCWWSGSRRRCRTRTSSAKIELCHERALIRSHFDKNEHW